MVWFSKRFFYLPAEGEFEQSVELRIDDGWKIELSMDNCYGQIDDYHDCECLEKKGVTEEEHNHACLRTLNIEQLVKLHMSICNAISYYYNQDESHYIRMHKCDSCNVWIGRSEKTCWMCKEKIKKDKQAEEERKAWWKKFS